MGGGALIDGYRLLDGEDKNIQKVEGGEGCTTI